MKRVCLLLGTLLLALALPLLARAGDPPPKTRALIITGGHDFERTPFFQMFDAIPDLTYTALEHPNAQDWFKADAAPKYDLIILYDLYQPISDTARADLLARLKQGKGLLVLHHAIANYQAWPEYAQIIGAKYYLEKTTVNGVEKPRSAYKHDVKFTVQIAAQHPITAGLQYFTIQDETYKWFDVAPGVTPLLTTDEPESNKTIAWAKTYEAARVAYIQLGHDHFAYQNPHYRQLIRQAIAWTAAKTK